eukprot:Blabericola_migrator_1__3817@NODE_214_length_11335_cov_18_891374_g182_i0_p1_GENE_NODE_214_length_11335_cov_18_891374_g182_i0NODE_214_length_11335_cov_18_891374_g182_i0_p1_ORF_typecomplete_len1706_score386_81EFhand_7/PF13499_6/25EFhand_7/PF13499_6/0_055EFhand_7/PF13499_6/0_02EFhand_8/PF13833_6/8_5e02EFhand_8/PF13833_6/0_0031SPARC_Ca_bdg/PF10591_9/6e03SPARC_Ca_bdg/PF10591_9/1_8e04SPARC_Ca_bdg/PF10591_9/0_17EFhand_1/PF00036_32/0_12GGACT/PF06094_12/0_21EFhand_6/PF13405_6/2_9e02EFhand_6/PF13405_6/3_7
MSLAGKVGVCGIIMVTAVNLLLDIFWQESASTNRFFYYLFHYINYYTRVGRFCSYLILIFSFFLWFIATALCWSDSYFPSLVVIGAVLFIVYSVSKSYDTAQFVVHQFLKDNLPRLLGLALDGWFDATNAQFLDLKWSSEREDNKTTSIKIRDALKLWKVRARRFKGSERLQFFESGGETQTESKAVGTHEQAGGWMLEETQLAGVLAQQTYTDPYAPGSLSYARTKQYRFFESKAARWHLDIWSTPRGDPLVVNEDGHLVHGDLEHLPLAARLATLEELEKEYSHDLQVLLANYNSPHLIAFEGGSLRITQYAEIQITRGLSPGTRFWKALVLAPLFPPAKALTYPTKLSMIFNYFDEEQRGRWREVEFRAWLAALRKPGVRQNWINLQRRMRTECRMKIHPVLGCALHDLDKYYKIHKLIDVDYSILFPSLNDEEEGHSDDASAKGESFDKQSDESRISSSSSSSDSQSDSDSSFEDPHLKKAQDDEEGSDETSDSGAEQEEIARKLKEDLNARKLYIIYNQSTKIHRDRKVDALLNQTNTFAIKILEIQFRVLSPIFGEQVLFKAVQKRQHLKLFQRLQSNLKREESGYTSIDQNHFIQTTRVQRLGQHSTQSESMDRMNSPMRIDSDFRDVPDDSSTTSRDQSTQAAKKQAVRFAIESEPNGHSSSTTSITLDPIDYVSPLPITMTRSFTNMMTSGLSFQSQEIQRRFKALKESIFKTENISKAVTEFYDRGIVEQTQRLSLWILTPKLDVRKQRIHPKTRKCFQSRKCITSHDLLCHLEAYFVTHETRIQHLLKATVASHITASDVPVNLLLEAFCTVGILDYREVSSECVIALVMGEGVQQHSQQISMRQPATEELAQFLLSQIEMVCDGTSDLTPTDLLNVSVAIISDYYWFDAFQFLLRLLGLRLEEDELPGRLAWCPKDFQKVASPKYSNRDESPSLTYKQNLLAAKSVFESLSAYTHFLHKTLSDECVLLLTENNLNFAATCACLKTMFLDYTDHYDGAHTVEEGLAVLGFTEMIPTLTIEPSRETLTSDLDWTWYWAVQQREAEGFTAVFKRITQTSNSFLSKSQCIQMILEMRQAEFCPEVATLNPMPLLPHDTSLNSSGGVDLCTTEMLHQVLSGARLTVSRDFTEIVWLLLCSQISSSKIVVRLPVVSVCEAVGLILTQARGYNKSHHHWRDPAGQIDQYSGWINYPMFSYLLQECKITIKEKHLRSIWNALRKEPLEITSYVRTNTRSPCRYWIRVATAKNDMDPYNGYFVKTTRVFQSLPKILLTGMWPEGMQSLVAFALQVQVSSEQLQDAARAAVGRKNRYGLIKPCDVAKIITALSVEGMSFAMLEEAVSKMRLTVPPGMVRHMFALMDVNHDKSLDLSELLRGFEVLFSNFIPPLIIEAVGVSTTDKLKMIFLVVGALVLSFIFMALAYSSFTAGNTSATGTAMQSILAVAGAYTMQSSAQQDERQVASGMYRRIEAILGEGLQKRLQEQEAMERVIKAYNEEDFKTIENQEFRSNRRSVFIHYRIPKHILLAPGASPMPTMIFIPGDHLWLVPELRGDVPTTPVIWQCIPTLPKQSGIRFDPTTGIMSGRVIDVRERWFREGLRIRDLAEREGLDLDQAWTIHASTRVLKIVCRNEGSVIAKTFLAYRVKPWVSQDSSEYTSSDTSRYRDEDSTDSVSATDTQVLTTRSSREDVKNFTEESQSS